MRELIAQFLSYCPRNKIIFTPTVPPCLKSVDIGYELASRIKENLSSAHLPMIAEDCFLSIVRTSIQQDEIIGEYIVLSNWGILFEPSLKLNLSALFDSLSKSHTLILSGCGRADFEKFHLVNTNYNTSFHIGNLHPYILQ